MKVQIDLPFFPGFDDEAPLSFYRYPDPWVWVVDDKLSEIQRKCGVEGLTEEDVIFEQRDYEKDVKPAWIEEWRKSAPENVVESVETDPYRLFNPNHACAEVKLKEGWQEVMRAFIRENESWLKEQDNEWLMDNCGFCGLLSKDIEDWSKYLFEDQDGDLIADMIGLMMLKENEDIPFDLAWRAEGKVDVSSYVFLTEEGLAKVVASEGDDQDDEMRVLSAVKKWYYVLTANDSNKDYYSTLIDPDRREEYLDSIHSLVKDKFRQEWYKNYCKELPKYWRPFDVDFVGFTDHLLETGHTERQDKFTRFIREYPMKILVWLDDAIPEFYRGLAKGNDYELVGLSKEEFIRECGDAMDYRYASVLEDKYGAAFAAEYIKATETYSDEYIVGFFEELVSKCDSEFILMQLMIYYRAENVDKSIQYASRLARMWTDGMISDEWIFDDVFGMAGIFENYDYNQCIADGDVYQDEDPEGMMFPYKEGREWLLKLLSSDFSGSIADLLSPFLKNALENIRNYNNRLPENIAPWTEGVQAIESFLARTLNQ